MVSNGSKRIKIRNIFTIGCNKPVTNVKYLHKKAEIDTRTIKNFYIKVNYFYACRYIYNNYPM